MVEFILKRTSDQRKQNTIKLKAEAEAKAKAEAEANA